MNVKQFLKTLHRNGVTSATLAGGAIRDSYLNQYVSDYDIFINSDQVAGLDINDWARMLDVPVLGIKDSTHFADSYIIPRVGSYTHHGVEYTVGNAKRRGLATVFDVLKNCVPFQLILVDMDPIEYVNTKFDIGLCKCYMTYDWRKTDSSVGKVWRVHFSDEFLHDQKNKTLTLSDINMNIREFEYIMEHHLPKLKAKYPSYSLVVPPYLQHLQNEHNKAPF